MSASDQERLARIALCRLAEPGDPRLTSLVSELGAIRVRDHLLAERDLRGLQTDIAARLADLDPATDLERARQAGIRYVIPGDGEWPTRLDDLAGAAPLQQRGGVPLGLWVRGPMQLDQLTSAVAVVGSRSSTSYGDGVSGAIGAGLAREGWWVVSGAAYGIDQAAHRGALAGSDEGSTVAVLACGVDRAYPASHQALLAHIAEVGAVISEVAPGCSPSRLRFLSRNRLIAALTTGTVVVEAAARSGALNTANWASRLHRVLMAVPGSVNTAQSQGTLELIRSGAAALVTEAADVLEMLGASGEHLTQPRRGPVRSRDRLNSRQQQVLDAVPLLHAAPVDSIARTAGIGLVEVRKALTWLLEAELVEQTETGWRLTPLASQ